MKAVGLQEVKAGLAPNLARLWRYGLVLSGARDVADDLVQATCVRAIERADQFQVGHATGSVAVFNSPLHLAQRIARRGACARAAASSTPAKR